MELAASKLSVFIEDVLKVLKAFHFVAIPPLDWKSTVYTHLFLAAFGSDRSPLNPPNRGTLTGRAALNWSDPSFSKSPRMGDLGGERSLQ
jgi:hypothetical protein